MDFKRKVEGNHNERWLIINARFQAGVLESGRENQLQPKCYSVVGKH